MILMLAMQARFMFANYISVTVHTVVIFLHSFEIKPRAKLHAAIFRQVLA